LARRQRTKSAIAGLPRHAAFAWAAVAGLAVFAATLLVLPRYAVAVGANAMFVTYLTLVAIEFPRLTADFLYQRPDEADVPIAAIFGIVVLVVIVAVATLFLTINSGEGRDQLAITISVVSVLLGWFTVHTMAALHYAHVYYLDDTQETSKVLGGLEFPGDERPDGQAFLYFAYVLGMTAQVADVAVSSARMRRLVTLHGVFAFFFNTVIVAATVNVVVAVAGS